MKSAQEIISESLGHYVSTLLERKDLNFLNSLGDGIALMDIIDGLAPEGIKARDLKGIGLIQTKAKSRLDGTATGQFWIITELEGEFLINKISVDKMDVGTQRSSSLKTKIKLEPMPSYTEDTLKDALRVLSRISRKWSAI